MNFINKADKLTNAEESFIIPEEMYINVLSAYINDEKISDEELKKLCE